MLTPSLKKSVSSALRNRFKTIRHMLSYVTLDTDQTKRKSRLSTQPKDIADKPMLLSQVQASEASLLLENIDASLLSRPEYMERVLMSLTSFTTQGTTSRSDSDRPTYSGVKEWKLLSLEGVPLNKEELIDIFNELVNTYKIKNYKYLTKPIPSILVGL